MVALTASIIHVRRIADAALDRPQGVTVQFRLDVYETLERCNTAARSFQVCFSSMRTRERKQRQARMKDKYVLDDEVMGLYDKLACTKVMCEDRQGFEVHLIPQEALTFDQNIIDRETGERVEEFSSEQRLMRKIVYTLSAEYKSAKEQHREVRDVLSAEDSAWLMANHADSVKEYWPELFALWDNSAAPTAATKFDLNDLPDDFEFGEG